MVGPTARILRFGIFALDVRAGELRRHGKRIRLQEQSFRILSMLLDRPGEVVLREEIRLTLWPNNTIVDFDHSINAAIKRLRGSLGESAEEPRYIETLAKRGYRLAQAASALNHPNICSIYGFESVGGQDAIVMELVEAKPSRRGSNRVRSLPIRPLDEAQRKGVVHRDLKPSNIMLTGRSSSGLVAKILDFGIAKMENPAIAGNVTEPGAVLGTWNYMSPEQADGNDADPRSA